MKQKEALRLLHEAGLEVVEGGKHLKVYTRGGKFIGVVARHPRMSGGHDPRAIRKILRAAEEAEGGR